MKSKIFTFLTMILFTLSCSHTEDLNPDLPGNVIGTRSAETSEDNYFLSTAEERRDIAEWLARNYTEQDVKKIHSAVTHAHSLGLDEVFFMRELVNEDPSSNKIANGLQTETGVNFAKAFCYNSANEKGFAAPSEHKIESFDFQSILNERLQIYWPYSQNWDGKTPPIITYAPDNVKSLSSIGFLCTGSNMVLKQYIVDESVCEKRPVWIINESETPYSEIPDFNTGSVCSSNGTIYSVNSGYPSINGPIFNDSARLETSGPLMTLRLGLVKSTKNHDSLFAGGSEYEFHFAFVKNTHFTCEADTSKCERIVSKIRQTFSRSEIKDGTVKELNSIAVSEWPSNLQDVILKLIETDPGGKKKTFDAKVTVKWKGKDYGIDVSVPFSNRDDEIGEKIYTRSFIRSTNNKNTDGSWAWDNSDGVYWTLPYQISMPNIDHGTIRP